MALKFHSLASVLGMMALTLSIRGAHAQDNWLQIPLDRSDATLPVYTLAHPQAIATVVLLPGGDASTGKILEGKPGSGNFLSRSRELFQAEGMNVMVVYRATDMNTLDYGYRISSAHVAEVGKAVAHARKVWGKPVWLVGTSRGTVSGTAAALALGQDAVQGLVLTSSVTSKKMGAIASQNIASLNIPTLVIHHKNDACKICVPWEASRLIADMKAAPTKKFIMVEGGSDPVGDPCEARHWHGFINHEKETVRLITDWIKNPQN